MTWLRTLPLCSLLLGLGCQNNTITLETDPVVNDDDSETGSDDTTDGGMVVTTAVDTADTVDDTGMPTGPQTLLMAISTPLNPSLPFQGIVNLTPNGSTVDLTLQFVSLDVGAVNFPRQLVGDVYAYPSLPVDDNNFFFWDTGVILIPGAANPIDGQDYVASIQAGVAPGPNPTYCGQVGGAILPPFDASLEGSTHGMTEIPNASTLPEEFAVGCP